MLPAFMAQNAWARGMATGLALLMVGCGIGIQRDLSTMKPPEVVYDDVCGLQEYFDALKSPQVSPPSEAFAQDFSKDGSDKGLGGTTRFRFSSEFQMHYVRRLLTANWKRLPPELVNAPSIDLEVKWAQKAGLKRVVTTEDARVTAGARSWDLPYHVCLSDLLFGAELYDTRRAFLQLPPPPPNPFIKGKDADAVTPAMAQADEFGSLEIKDGGAAGADAVAQQPVVGATPEVPAVVGKPGTEPLQPSAVQAP
jgi:hypothetical protein